MTPEEILEGNKLISEFIDLVFKKEFVTSDPFEWMAINANMRYYDDMEDDFFFDINPYMYLRFYCSWDWLMPVVYKISRMTDDPEINKRFRLLIENFINTIEINYAFFGTVEFIKWYNEQKS